jgi:hypothetical protein
MKRALAFAALLLPALSVLAATQEDVANAPVQTVDPVYVWIFLVGFIGAIIAGCVWYFFGEDKEQK